MFQSRIQPKERKAKDGLTEKEQKIQQEKERRVMTVCYERSHVIALQFIFKVKTQDQG